MTGFPKRYSNVILTTNFDPLLSIAVLVAGGTPVVQALDSDGSLWAMRSSGRQPEVRIVHLHGYWTISDTLHTPIQLQLIRPRLRAALEGLLRDHLVVVVGYGGWEDAFTDALVAATNDEKKPPNVVWAFHEHGASDIARRYRSLFGKLEPVVRRGRFRAYRNIECNQLLTKLLERERAGGSADTHTPRGGRGQTVAPATSPSSPPRADGRSPTDAGKHRQVPRQATEEETLRPVVNVLGELLREVVQLLDGSEDQVEPTELRVWWLPRAYETLRKLAQIKQHMWPDPQWAGDLSAARVEVEMRLQGLEKDLGEGAASLDELSELWGLLTVLRDLIVDRYPETASTS